MRLDRTGPNRPGKDLVSSSSMTIEPITTALPTGSGTCQVCGTSVQNGTKVHRCPECDTPHHLECWRYNNDQCAIFGCRSGNARPDLTRKPPARLPGKIDNQRPPPTYGQPPASGGMMLAKIMGTMMLIAALVPSSGSSKRNRIDNSEWDHEKITHMLQWGDGPPRVKACRLLATIPNWGDNDWFWIQNAATESGYPDVRMEALRTLATHKPRQEACRAVIGQATGDRDERVSQLAQQLLSGR